MYLPRTGREYARIPITGVPDGATLEAQVDNSAWVPLEPTTDTATDGAPIWQFLVYGPDATDGEGLEITAQAGVRVRLTDNPETIIRNAGTIRLV